MGSFQSVDDLTLWGGILGWTVETLQHPALLCVKAMQQGYAMVTVS